jgi:hypothetical protein
MIRHLGVRLLYADVEEGVRQSLLEGEGCGRSR